MNYYLLMDKESHMPTLTVLVGLPGSGKSTSIPDDFDGFVYSTDRYIEQCAKMNGMTYNEAFREFIDPATKTMNEQLEIAIRQKADVIWDQTNMSSKKRYGLLSRFPRSYYRLCVCRVPPRDDAEWIELNSRLLGREGKTIPPHVVESMADTYVEPTFSEGFDEVHLYDIYGNRLNESDS
jgi:predicted kinase